MTSKLTRRRLIAALPATFLAGRAMAGPTPAPKDAYLYFIWPGDGQRIGGLAAAVEIEDGLVDGLVVGQVEVVALDLLVHVGDGVLGQHHRA